METFAVRKIFNVGVNGGCAAIGFIKHCEKCFKNKHIKKTTTHNETFQLKLTIVNRQNVSGNKQRKIAI